jgi:hypothetical protein
MSNEEFKIVAFCTNETSPSPNDIIKIFLDQHSSIITTQSLHVISCEFSLPNFSQPKKMRMISLPDISRIYDGISDVNFYFLFVYLDNINAQKNFELVCDYMKKHCDLKKKIFIFGVLKDEFSLKNISKENIQKICDLMLFNYIYYEISMANRENIVEIFLNIFSEFSQESENNINISKDEFGQQAHSCVFF